MVCVTFLLFTSLQPSQSSRSSVMHRWIGQGRLGRGTRILNGEISCPMHIIVIYLLLPTPSKNPQKKKNLLRTQNVFRLTLDLFG